MLQILPVQHKKHYHNVVFRMKYDYLNRNICEMLRWNKFCILYFVFLSLCIFRFCLQYCCAILKANGYGVSRNLYAARNIVHSLVRIFIGFWLSTRRTWDILKHNQNSVIEHKKKSPLLPTRSLFRDFFNIPNVSLNIHHTICAK